MVVRYSKHNLDTLKTSLSDMVSNGNLIRLVTIFSLFMGIVMLGKTISDLRSVHERALELSHASHSLHKEMVGSAERLSRTSKTLKSANRPGKKMMFRLEPQNMKDSDSKNLETVLHRLGFDDWDGDNRTWSLLWSLGCPNKLLSTLTSINQFQKVNHMPGMSFAFTKTELARSHNKYMPTSFILPDEKDEFLDYASERLSSQWLIKDCTGVKSPTMAFRFMEIDLDKAAIVQEYCSFPALVDYHKFDVGVFVLVTSMDPLRIYVYEKDWLVRYATDIFEIQSASLQDMPKLLVQKDFFATWDVSGVRDMYEKYKLNHKQSLLHYIKNMYMVADTDPIEEDIYNIISETIKGHKSSIVSTAAKQRGDSRSFFQLMRFDFMIDLRMIPILLDIDLKPDLSTTNQPQLSSLFEQMIYDGFSLLGLGSKLKSRPEERTESCKDMIVDNRDIQVFPSQCITPECKSCSKEICQLCAACMPNNLKNHLQDAYREHEERRNFKRVYPVPLHSKNGAKERSGDIEMDMFPKDRLLDLWFRGKCIQDETWCS